MKGGRRFGDSEDKTIGRVFGEADRGDLAEALDVLESAGENCFATPELRKCLGVGDKNAKVKRRDAVPENGTFRRRDNATVAGGIGIVGDKNRTITSALKNRCKGEMKDIMNDDEKQNSSRHR